MTSSMGTGSGRPFARGAQRGHYHRRGTSAALDQKERRREVTPGEMFGIAGVGVAFVAVLVAVGASVCLVLRGDRDEEEHEEK